MTMNKIENLKVFAKANIKKGMAFYVEHFTDADWKVLLGDNNHCVSDAKAEMYEMASMQLAKRVNSISTVVA